MDKVITTSWDDGGKKDLRIARLLKRFNLPGVFYIVVDWVGKDGYLTWDDIKRLDAQGFEIGSHTITHPHDLKDLFYEDLFYEIQSSKEMIETVLGHNISKFCYPRGRFNERVEEVVKSAGYIEARMTGKPTNTDTSNPYRMPGNLHIAPRPEYAGRYIVDVAKEIIDKSSYVNIWGHSEEIHRLNLWDELVDVLMYARNVREHVKSKYSYREHNKRIEY